MARNLQAKLPSSDTLRIYDINPDSTKRFADETKALSSGAAVEVASNVREAAEDSVGCPKHSLLCLLCNSPFM
jgi:3-hydroxyisobutyrate dehydrogenase